jgi:HisA/HisF family protein
VRIIPVIDLRGGRAVRGRSGERERYRPVRSRLSGHPEGDLSDPAALLAAYRSTLRPDIVYVADLDRIMGQGDNDAVLKGLVGSAPELTFLWDGGLPDTASIALAVRHGRLLPVIGTETLRSVEDLHPLQPSAPGSRPVLSLDLCDAGVVSRSDLPAALREEDVLRRARLCGFRTVILLLLDRVGTSRGLSRDRLLRLRLLSRGLDLLVGGGIATIDDLVHLRDSGFSGALLATALHDGQISPAELRRRGFLA